MLVYTKNREQIVIADSAMSSGGEGEVREIITAPSRFANSCAKIYYQKRRTKQLEEKINYMTKNPPAKVVGNGFMIGWPIASLYDSSLRFLGFVMPLAPKGSKQLVNLTSLKISKKLESEWHIKYDRTLGKKSLIARLKLINNIAIPVHLLHATGRYVLKDFKPQNILVTHTGQVTIVDMDSVQITEHGKLLFPASVATDGYMPPEFYTDNVGHDITIPILQSWDLFALGVIYYQILFGLHPFVVTPWMQKDDSSNEISQNIAQGLFPFGSMAHKVRGYPEPHNNFKIIPLNLQNFFKRAFSNNPSSRPSAEEWGKAIHAILASTKHDIVPSEQKPIPRPTPKPAPKPMPEPSPRPIPKPTPQPAPNPGPNYDIVPHNINHFNWGAFFFNWIWAVCHGIWWPILINVGVGIILILEVPILTIIANIASLSFWIWFGFAANALAWKKKHWKSTVECMNSEKKWNKASIWFLVILLVFAVILVIGNM